MLKAFIAFVESLMVGAVVYMIGRALSEEYIHSLRKTGGVILASEVQEAKMIPVIIAIIATLLFFMYAVKKAG